MPARAFLLPCALLAGLVLVMEGCGDEGAEPDPVARRHVGREVCARCHAEEAAAWTGSHHDLAMGEAEGEILRGDFSGGSLDHHGVTTIFDRVEGRPIMRTPGRGGAMETLTVAYTFGVEPLQQFLARREGGRYQVLPACWDARPEGEGGQRWFALNPKLDLRPGDPLHWTGVDQTWNFMCADCHSTGLRKGYDAVAKSYETTWSEIDVSCEACHGPGSEHVALAEAGEGAAAIAALRGLPDHAWVLDEGAPTARREGPLPGPEQIESCGPCHSRRLRFREEVRPEEPLLQSCRVALLEEDLYHADGQILDEVYVYGSFLQSRMYHQGVTCTDCHEPHRSTLRSTGNTLCYRCHRPEHFDVPEHHFHPPGSEGALCVNCHMPETLYMEVDGRRDHSIRVPRPDLTQRLGTPNACNACHRDRDAQWAAEAIDRHHGRDWRKPHYATAIHAGRRGARGAARLLENLAHDSEQPAIARATAARLLGRNATAETPGILARLARDEAGLVRLGAAQALQDLPLALRSHAGARLLADPLRAVRIEAARWMAAVPEEGLSPTVRTRRDRGLQEAIEAEEFNADSALSNVNLAALHADRGDLDRAHRWLVRALELEPELVPAWVNLGDLERRRSGDAAALTVLEEAAKKLPGEAAVQHALGLAHVRVGAPDRALPLLEEAARLAPGSARYGYVHGIALDSVGRRRDAILALEAAVQRHPDDPELRYGLATICRDAGRKKDALRHARHLLEMMPGDRRWLALMSELEGSGHRR